MPRDTWAESVPGFFRLKGTPPRKAPARGIAASVASQWVVLEPTTICVCYSADKLAFRKNTCALIKEITGPLPRSVSTKCRISCRDLWSHLADARSRIRSRLHPSSKHFIRRVQVPCVAPEDYQPFFLVPLVYFWTRKDGPVSRTVSNLFRQMMESIDTVRHHTAVDHYSWCRRANSTVANPGSTKENAVHSNATSMSPVYPLEVSMNSRNSSNLGLSSASRSTFRHSTFPERSWIPTSRSPVVCSLVQAA